MVLMFPENWKNRPTRLPRVWPLTLLLGFHCVTQYISIAGVSSSPHLSGGSTTVFQSGPNAFGLPLANITRNNRRAHVVGNSFFNKNWVTAPASTVARDGLGPLFNARSCSSCHLRDGRGRPPEQGELMTGLLFRLSSPNQDGKFVPDSVLGSQLGVRSIPGAQPEGDVQISYDEVIGYFDDGSKYSLLKPEYTLTANPIYGKPSDDIRLSPRIAQPLIGLGLLEALAEKTILSLSDPDDLDGDGISGRPNYIWNPEKKIKQLGRFGWKANQPTLLQQTASAFVGDIGITSSIRPDESYTSAQAQILDNFPSGGSPEIDDHLLGRVVTYLQTLAPPAQRDYNTPDVTRGRDIFSNTGCASCHIPRLETGNHQHIPELANQIIRPYTDLLLHDMGPELSDKRPDGEASGSEWRTPPLWGIGLTKIVNGHTRFLHDGRARNLEEAILWHGGEADHSRRTYLKLSKLDRKRLLAFIESL